MELSWRVRHHAGDGSLTGCVGSGRTVRLKSRTKPPSDKSFGRVASELEPGGDGLDGRASRDGAAAGGTMLAHQEHVFLNSKTSTRK